MDVAIAATLVVAVAGSILLWWFTRRHRMGWDVALRPVRGLQRLKEQSERSIESGRAGYVSLGQADLGGRGSPTSVAALEVLDYLAVGGARGGTTPRVTVGDGTLLLAAQDSLLSAHREAGKLQEYAPDMAQFIAGRGFAMGYAAGVSDVVNQGRPVEPNMQADADGNLLLGRFGSEVAIMAEAGERQGLEQVIGSDDPLALAIGAAVTENVLIGEELFAAGAYLQDEPVFSASLQLQDVLRVVAIVIVMLVALLNFILK